MYHAEDMDCEELRQALANMCNAAYNQALEDVQKEFDSYCEHALECTKDMDCIQCAVDKLRKENKNDE